MYLCSFTHSKCFLNVKFIKNISEMGLVTWASAFECKLKQIQTFFVDIKQNIVSSFNVIKLQTSFDFFSAGMHGGMFQSVHGRYLFSEGVSTPVRVLWGIKQTLGWVEAWMISTPCPLREFSGCIHTSKVWSEQAWRWGDRSAAEAHLCSDLSLLPGGTERATNKQGRVNPKLILVQFE